MNGTDLPHVVVPPPGPRSRALVDSLARYECPAVTARRVRRAAWLGAANDDPIVWEEAVGANVKDADGNVYVDLTSGFGVALVGHRDPSVVAAVDAQTSRLLHAMGDAFPDIARIQLLERLATVAPPGLEVALLGLSGADAVEGAVKTALLATRRSATIVFEGGYHGLSLGALPLQTYKDSFSAPFRDVLPSEVRRLPWACPVAELRASLGDGRVGLVLVEPIQGRGGMRPAPAGWLADVRSEAHNAGALVAFDEIQCGLGRTGQRWACDADGVVPDLLCTGKALGGGFPLSACLGTREVMNAWGASTGEALHTQTFLGHPVGCAAGLAVLEKVAGDLPARAAFVGNALRDALEERGFAVRGRGLMLGVELGARSLAVSRTLLGLGYLVLPAGRDGEVLALTPPVCLTADQLQGFVDALARAVP